MKKDAKILDLLSLSKYLRLFLEYYWYQRTAVMSKYVARSTELY